MPQRRLQLVDWLHAVRAGRIAAEPPREPQHDLPCGTAGAGVLARGGERIHRRVHVLHIPTEIRVGGVVGVRLFDRLLLELRGGADIAAGKRVKMRGVGVGVRHGIWDHGLRQLRLARTVLFGAEARLLASGFLEFLGEPLRALLADPLDDPVDFVRGSGVLVRVAQRVDGGGQTGHRVRERRIPLEFAGGAHECAELRLRADTGTGIAHCPVSNMKLSSGVCRIPDMLRLGIRVSLAVDGAASNDGQNLMAEIRAAYLLHRLTYGSGAPSGYELLKMATRGGAAVLGRDDIGQLSVGKAGDLFLVDASGLDTVGVGQDPGSFLGTVGCSKPAKSVVVAGREVVRDGRLLGIDEEETARKAQACAGRLNRA